MIHSHCGILYSNESKQTVTTLNVMDNDKYKHKRKKPDIDKYIWHGSGVPDRKEQPQQDTSCSQTMRPVLSNKWNELIVGQCSEKS